MLSESEKKQILQIARKSLEEYFLGADFEMNNLTGALRENRGAFVTLKKHGQLRGCIGYVKGIKPLGEAVAELAIEAATGDPRFSPVTASELPDIDIEISAMTPLERVKNADDIVVGRHGLYIKKGYKAGLLLPQVATEWNWNREKFLEQTCYKAGLDKQSWKEKDTEIFSFTAEVFGEKHK
jgi:AmmeMemoRadiSam system protein A